MIKKRKKEINVKESEGNDKKRKITNKTLFMSLLVTSVFLSCVDEKVNNDPGKVLVSEPLTEEKCVNFAEQMHHSFADSSLTYLDSYLAWEQIKQEVAEGSPLKRSIFDTLRYKYGLAGEFVDLVYAEADVRFITYYQEGESHYLVFRTFEEPQSLNFYEFQLKGNEKALEISDVYNFMTSSSMKQTLMAEVQFWSKWENEWYVKFTEFEMLEKEFRVLVNQGDLKGAFLLTKKYEEDFKDLSRFSRLYGIICEQSGSSQLMIGHLEDELAKIGKLEKGRWLMTFYLRSLQGDYAEGMMALSNLEKEVGADLYIDFLKGNLYFEMGDYEEAVNWFNKALSVESTVKIFHLAKAHAYVNLKQYTEAVESLLVMEDYFELNEYDWELEFSAYPEFVESSEFEKLLFRLNGPVVQ